MESLSDRSCRVLDQSGRSVASIATMVRLLRADGCAVTEWVLVRALRLDPRFRVLDPLRGPLNALRPWPLANDSARLTVVHIDQARAVPIEPRTNALAAPRHLIKQSLARLAVRDEPFSPMDQVRWLCMLRMAGLDS